MIDVNPADVAVEMLTEALPGFESRIIAARDAVGIRGALPIGAEVSHEAIMWPVFGSPAFVDVQARALFDATESDAMRAHRHAQQREALRRDLAPVIDRIVEQVRNLAIDAVGLAPVIAERERKAFERGRHEGYQAGLAKGRTEIEEAVESAVAGMIERILGATS